MYALIFADNKYQANRMGILRAPGAHRIATHLRRQNINTEVIDFYLDWTLDELKEIIDNQLSLPTLFIGFSCSLMFDGIDNFISIRNYIKEKNPNVPIVIGGNKTLQKGFQSADYYIEGTGESAITALVDYLQQKSQTLVYKDINGNKILDSLTDYKVNSIKGLDIEYLPSDFINPDEVLSLETARGCIFKCAFCDFPGIGKNKLDYLRDRDEIVAELTKNYRNNGTTKYFIVEDTINDTDDKCEMLAEIASMLPFELSLMGYMRADLLISKPKNLDYLMQAGFKGMHFGLETFNEQAGKIIGKGMPSSRLKEGLIDIKRRYPNLHTTSTFIVGLPYETREEILKSLDWLVDSKALDFWSFNPLIIPRRDPTVHHSYFTDNYRLYGYNVMPKEEVQSRQSELDGTAFGLKWWRNIIYWQSKTFDYISAAKFVTEISQKSYQYRKIDGWSAFAMSGLGYELSELFQKSYNGKNKINDELLKQQSNEYIKKYKQQKLNFIKSIDKLDKL